MPRDKPKEQRELASELPIFAITGFKKRTKFFVCWPVIVALYGKIDSHYYL
jgi:hypothetical protein